MIKKKFEASKRSVKTVCLESDLVVVGGGMAGVCAALTAAREGIRVVLVQDRPVLGGNASSEVRLWVLGATSHMGNNNRWAREGGVIDEILVENMYKNKEGNPVIFDTIVLDKVQQEPNIRLLLNTTLYDLEKSSPQNIEKVYAFCSQNETRYEISAPLFCDASGDGIAGYLAGSGYRVGAEDSSEFNEKFAPDQVQYGELLGHSIYFYSKDAGVPVEFHAPSYALKDIERIPRFRNINTGEHGCKFWWLEYGGRKDTIHDTEDIKWELWSVVYGVWDYIKNSGVFEGVDNLTLEWVGLLPGKRESRRFEGLYTLTQQDIIEQTHHHDAIAYGGWAIDLHPADGVFSKENGCTQFHSKGIYELPYRCYVSRDIRNLFFAGRCISVSHVAHGSTRVMGTSAFGAQAVGMAAAECIRQGVLPATLLEPPLLNMLRDRLSLKGQSIPGYPINEDGNLAKQAFITASSTLELAEIPFDGEWYRIEFSVAQLLPLQSETRYVVEVEVEADEATTLIAELKYSRKIQNFTPDFTAGRSDIELCSGKQRVAVSFDSVLAADQYAFIVFRKNPKVKIRTSSKRISGTLSVFNKFNHAVNNFGIQEPPIDSGIDSFEFWCPERRPKGANIAMTICPALTGFGSGNLVNGYLRPTVRPNTWVASLTDSRPNLKLCWEAPVLVTQVQLFFDTDMDHPMESVQMGHPEKRIPFCVKSFRLLNDQREVLYETTDNYQSIKTVTFEKGIVVNELIIEMDRQSETIPCALVEIYIPLSN